jgi:hypothetical protein
MRNKHHFENSNSLSYCDYHEDKGTLEIGFMSGGCYHYPNCPRSEYEALKKAESAGKHFHVSLRHRYKGIKVK